VMKGRLGLWVVTNRHGPSPRHAPCKHVVHEAIRARVVDRRGHLLMEGKKGKDIKCATHNEEIGAGMTTTTWNRRSLPPLPHIPSAPLAFASLLWRGWPPDMASCSDSDARSPHAPHAHSDVCLFSSSSSPSTRRLLVRPEVPGAGITQSIFRRVHRWQTEVASGELEVGSTTMQRSS
jgi:hypothetical protein